MRTIRARLTLWYLLLLFLTLTFFSAVTYLGVSRSLHNQFDRSFSLEVQRFIEESEIEEDGELDLELEMLSHGELVAVYDAQGNLLVQHDGPPKTEAQGIKEGYDSYYRGGIPWRRTTRFAPHLNLWLQVSRSQEELVNSLHYLFWFLVAGVPTTVLIAGVGGLFLASRLLNPLDRITRAAASLSAERLSQRLPTLKSKDELSRLVDTFNGMLARLDDSFARQKQFTSDAAHELRTPLARLLAKAEVTLSKPRTDEEYRAAIEEMSDGIKSLSSLLAKLLLIARDDAGTLRSEWEPLDLSELVQDVVRSLEPLERGVVVRTTLAPAPFKGDQTRLTELVLNLLENASRHSPEGGLIELSVSREPDLVELSVKDQGPGVPPALRERIFERFYQADQSRHPEGAGLGLAICRAVAHQHGGEIELDHSYSSGACFIVRLPV